MSRSLLALPLVVFILLTLVIGCGDSCVDVVCGPAPPALQVQVRDTFTSMKRLPRTPGGTDTVDTNVKEIRLTVDAIVTLARIQGSDTVSIDTLDRVDSTFTRNDLAGLPDTTLILIARRNGRRVVQPGLTIRRVEGCCPYSIIGFYTMTLPQ